MKNGITLLLIAILSFFQTNIAAQQFGQNPSDIDWKVMKSESAKIIFPEGMKEQAQRISNIVNYMDKNNRLSVGKKKRLFEMVLTNRSTLSNGYVQLAPFRSEFFATPPQTSSLFGSIDFLDILTIHEYRHNQHFANTKNGLTKFLYYLAGQNGWALGHIFSVPNFYTEGDAVAMETLLSDAGRGRMPDFTKEQRALAFSDKQPTYMQMRNGSFRKMIPDHYRWGYMMNQFVRDEYGEDKLAKILKDASNYSSYFYAFSGANKRHTGMRTGKIYKESWYDLQQKWKEQLSETKLIPSKRVTKEKWTITHYGHPTFTNGNSVLAVKSSFDKTEELVLISGEKEKRLTTIGNNFLTGLTYNKNLAAWTELGIDVRWANETYSNIIVYDLKTDKKKKLTNKTRLFSPAVSPDAKKIAAVNIPPEQAINIWILNSKTGKVIKKIDNPDNAYLSRLAWAEDGNSIVAVYKKDNKMSLAKFDLSNGTITQLLEPTFHVVDEPFIKSGRVFFNASFTGIDNIFSTDLDGSKTIRQETSVEIAATQPAVSKDGESLIFTDFTAHGTMISKVDLTNEKGRIIKVVEPSQMPFYSNLNNSKEGGSILNNLQEVKTEVKKYSGLFKNMKLHSWGFLLDGDYGTLKLPMQNLRNDVNLNLEGRWGDRGEQFYGADLEIGRTFLTFGLKGAYNKGNGNISGNRVLFEEISVGPKVGLPLKWIRGNYTTNLNLSTEALFRNLNVIQESNNFLLMESDLEFANLRRMALQNVGSRGGQRFSANYQRAFLNAENQQLSASASIYFPGFFPNHAVRIQGNYLNKFEDFNFQFIDDFHYTRGYSIPLVVDFTTASLDYALPVFYPDMGYGKLIYFKRVRANLFMEYGVGQLSGVEKSISLSSAGCEVYLDNVYFNIFPLGLGVRVSSLLNEDPVLGRKNRNVELVLGTEF